MAGVDGNIKMPISAAAVAVSLPRTPVKPSVQVSSVVSSQTQADSRASAQYGARAMSEAVAARKLEALEQIEQNIKELKEAADQLTQTVEAKGIALSFSVDEASKRFVVQVKDSNTGEVIRHIPGEAVLRTAATLESLKGLLFDDVY